MPKHILFSHFLKSQRETLIILMGIFVLMMPNKSFADPDLPGRIVFLGRTSDGARSVWLSATARGSFEVQARNQTVDQWDKPERGLHVTLSPMVSNGSGDPHSLFQIINNSLVFLDKDNQQGGITFPPFPGLPPPGVVTPPIFIPPGGIATPPIALPPSGEVGQEPLTVEMSDQLNTVPITRSREFGLGTHWNVWFDGRYYDIVDHRNNLDLNGQTTDFTVGTDRHVNDDLVAGVMIGKINGRSSSFNSDWQSRARGFSAGPYFGDRVSQNWVIDGILEYGQFDNDNNISSVNGAYPSHAYSASVTAIGLYNVGKFQLRPKPAIYYTYFHNGAYNLSGSADDGTAFAIPVAADNFSYGISELALETSRPFVSDAGKVIVPYVELGVDYAFTRPNGGQMLSGDLLMVSTSPWSGLARVGARTPISKSAYVDVSASYLSVGQPGLNVWEGWFYLSYAF